ncbi:lipase member I-like [Physella acuta]|uniref:lipase member I-like n=1 Tax=Physella acuta TaxID=109671 RepID=UPI0027DE8011|nr:lipase member I-like [Physella acuta]XP_059170484.1 lipase member I-like [Physella acuta]
MMMMLNKASFLFTIVWYCVTHGIASGWLMSGWWTPCYTDPPIGCFPTSYPYNNTGGMSPQSPYAINVYFRLHNRNRNIVFNLNNVRQETADVFNPALKTVFIIHGYFEHGNISWILNMVNELRNKGDLNVVVVDWSGGASSLIYHQSVANTRVVGAVLALLLQEMIALGARPSQFHLIGFSLGAHVAGYTGQIVSGVARITGLDPAGPSFKDTPPEVHLDPSDARVVDVIHTDTGSSLSMGARQPMGTLDFYPNGGDSQPGCSTNLFDLISAVMFNFDRGTLACSHLRAVHLFTSTINNNCSFPTERCASSSPWQHCAPCDVDQCPQMGYNLDTPTADGAGFVYKPTTSGQPPFCSNK